MFRSYRIPTDHNKSLLSSRLLINGFFVLSILLFPSYIIITDIWETAYIALFFFGGKWFYSAILLLFSIFVFFILLFINRSIREEGFRKSLIFKCSVLSIAFIILFPATRAGAFGMLPWTKTELPKIYKSEAFMELDSDGVYTFELFEEGNEAFALIYIGSKLYFGSGHMYIGYYRNGRLKDEIFYGEMSIDMTVDFKSRTVNLGFYRNLCHPEYADSWVDRYNSIGGYKIIKKIENIKPDKCLY